MGMALFRNPLFRDHDNGPTHIECPARLLAIDDAIAASGLPVIDLPCLAATDEHLLSVHHPAYIAWLEEIDSKSRAAGRRITVDLYTHMSPASWAAAKLAVGASVQAIESLNRPDVQCAFAFVRPVGHHAAPDASGGFSLLNNVAIAARHGLNALGFRRVLIVDWDVHHGNGTQAAFWNDPNVLLISFQRFPQWPGTGWFTEVGGPDGLGYNINIPLPTGTGDDGYLSAWEKIVIPVALEYKPDVILVSAGYDAHELDPIGEMKISTAGYGMLSSRLAWLAATLGIKVAAFLEGGYHPASLGDSVVETCRALLGGGAPQAVPTADRYQRSVAEHLDSTRRHLVRYWPCLRSGA